MHIRLNRFLGGLVLLASVLAACRGTPLPPPPSVTLTSLHSATGVPPTITAAPPTTQAASPTLPPPPSPTQTPTIAPTATETPAVANLPDPASASWKPVVTGLHVPVFVTNAGDGSGRLFILEQAGIIRIFQNGNLLDTPFLDIRSRVKSGGERGLLGLAFHPQYAQNGYFYINYTNLQGNTVIARYQVSANDPNRADPSSEKRLIFVQQPFRNHNGGEVTFGPDGYLYLGLGDGGSQGDPNGNGQSLNTLLGKILRIDVNNGDPYAIPPDNPFQGTGKTEIWAYGLRNPWRFSFDQATGDLYIGDVGQNLWEEIDYLPAGSPGGTNFGWNYMEGLHPYDNHTAPQDLQLTAPVAEYSHQFGCAVVGGFVYLGKQLPDWQGVFLFGDYCSGIVWGLLRTPDGTWQQKQLYQNVGRISSFGEDESGEIYLTDLRGSLFQLVNNNEPTINPH
jgi:glucose/arabinose dehydrogenase